MLLIICCDFGSELNAFRAFDFSVIRPSKTHTVDVLHRNSLNFLSYVISHLTYISIEL